jgi:hypothetical protein
MTYQDVEGNSQDCLTPREAYLAMFYFVDAYWRRGGRAEGSVTFLLNGLGPAHNPDDAASLLTTDPAFWSDWVTAMDVARSRGVPKSL